MRRFTFKDITTATLALLAAGLLVSLLIAPARAADYTWALGETGGEWTTDGNWDLSGYPNANTDTAIFDTTVTATGHQTITQASDVILEKLEFTAVGSSKLLRIGDSTHTITFAGADPTLQSNANYGGWAALNINSKVDVGTGGLTVTSTGTGNIGSRLASGIIGSGDVTVDYGGLELNAGSASFTGKFIITSNGTIQVLGNSAAKLGDTAHGTVINGTGILKFRGASGTTSEPIEVNGINTTGSIRNFVSSVTMNGPVTLNHDASFSIYDWASGGTAGTKRDFFINSVIAEGSGGPHNVFFLGNLSSSSAQGTESRKGEMVLGTQSTYGGNTYLTTNKANDVTAGSFSGNLRLAIDDALPTTTLILGGSHAVASGTLGTGAGNGKFALGGHDQELAGLLTSGTGTENRVVGNSTTLSTLTLNIASGTNTYDGYLGWTDTDDNNLALVKKGAGTLELSVANTYEGTTTVEAGALTITNDGALGATAGGTVVQDGAVLRVEGGITVAEPITITGPGVGWSGSLSCMAGSANTWSGPITIGGGGTRIGVTSGALFTLTGGITGDGFSFGSNGGTIRVTTTPINVGTNGVTVLNGSTLELNVGGNTWGSTRITYGGTLKLGLDDAMPTSTALVIGHSNDKDGTLDLNSFNQTIAGLWDEGAGSRRVVNSGAGTPTLTVNNSSDYTFAGTLGNTGQDDFGLTKDGAGTQTLSGANTFTGGTTIDLGTIQMGHANALGTGSVQINTGGILNVAAVGVTNDVTLNGGTLYFGDDASGVASGTITLNDVEGNRINANHYYRIVSGKVTGAGGFTVGGIDTPGVALNNPANDFAGDVSIDSGAFLNLLANEVIPNTATITVKGALRLSGDGRTETIAGLSGSGNIFATGGATTLRVGANDATSTFSGKIGVGGDLRIHIEKIGDGILTLTGNNAYTGPTSVDAGALLVNGSHTGGGIYTVADGATLGGTGALDAAVDVQPGGHVGPGASTGSLEIGNLSMSVDSFFDVEIGGTNAGAEVDGYDQLIVSGDVALGGATLNLSLLGGYPPAVGGVFYLLVNDDDDPITGKFTFNGNLLDEGDEVQLGSTGFLATYQADSLTGALSGGNDFALTAVPEPSTFLLSTLGLLGLAFVGRRRKR